MSGFFNNDCDNESVGVVPTGSFFEDKCDTPSFCTATPGFFYDICTEGPCIPDSECIPPTITVPPVSSEPFVPVEVTLLDNQGLTWTGFGVNNIVITDNQQNMIFNYRGYGPFRKSTDTGVTFSSMNLRQQNSGEPVITMAYNDTIDRLYVFPYYNSGRQMRSEYSDDFYSTAGVVWNPTNTPFGNGLANSYAHGPLMIGEEMYHLNAESIGRDAKIINHIQVGVVGAQIEYFESFNYEPGTGDAVPISTGDLSSWTTVEVGSKLFITYSSQGQSINYGMMVNKSDLSTINLGLIVDPGQTGSWHAYAVASDGTTARVLTKVEGSVATFGLVTESTTSNALPTVTYDFGEAISDKPTIGYGNGRWFVCARASADGSRLLCMGDGISGVAEVQLPVSLRPTEVYRQLYWDSYLGRWLFATTSDDVVSREMYLFALDVNFL